jgi:hypothetical protein
LGYPQPEQQLPPPPSTASASSPPVPPPEPLPESDIDAKITTIMSSPSSFNLLKDDVITAENSAFTTSLQVLTRSAAETLSNILSVDTELISDDYVENVKTLNKDETLLNHELPEGEIEGTDIVGGAETRRQTLALASIGTNNPAGYDMTSDFENNIKDTTYVLLNACKDYKNNQPYYLKIVLVLDAYQNIQLIKF